MGRRTILVWGLFLLFALMLLVGILSAALNSAGSSYAQAGLILAWLFLYYSTLGPVTYAIISETSAIKLRNKSVCLARIGYYLVGLIVGTIQPYMLNPTEGNWKGKTCLFWGRERASLLGFGPTSGLQKRGAERTRSLIFCSRIKLARGSSRALLLIHMLTRMNRESSRNDLILKILWNNIE